MWRFAHLRIWRFTKRPANCASDCTESRGDFLISKSTSLVVKSAALPCPLTNNIAEGHGRYHYLDEIKFELQARGSLAELVDDLNVCEDEQYLSPTDIADLKERASEVQRLINGYIRFLRNRKSEALLVVRESAVEDELLDEFSDSF